METNRDTIEELTLVIEHTAYEYYRTEGDSPHEIASENVLRAILDGIITLRPEVERQVLNASVLAGRLSVAETMGYAFAPPASEPQPLEPEVFVPLQARKEILVDA